MEFTTDILSVFDKKWALLTAVFYKEPDTVSDRILVGYGIGIRPV